MPGFDASTVVEIQQANNITDVVGEYVSLAKKGREWVGICPFHEDHRPSMYVNEEKRIFKCFACGAGGDVIKFVQLRENLSFRQAIERLAERAGIEVRWGRGRSATAPRSESGDAADPLALARVNDWAARFFRASLEDPAQGQDVRAYLERRGISEASQSQWRLGLAPRSGSALLAAARKRDVPASLLQQAGLLTRGGRDRFSNRLMFPITDPGGRVIAFGGRTLDNDSAKYINSPTTPLFDKSNCLYGLELARPEIARGQTAVVVEGYTDCIMAHQHGIGNVVATLGTSFANGHARLLRRYGKRVILFFDGDTAGAAAADRALDVCLRNGIDILVATISGGVDPCDFLVEHGADAFRAVLADAVDVFTFKWDRLQSRFASDDSMMGRKAALEDYLQGMAVAVKAGNLSAINRGLVVNRLSAVLGLSTRQLEDELTERIRRIRRVDSADGPVTEQGSLDADSEAAGRRGILERELLEVLLGDGSLFSEMQGQVTPSFFESTRFREIAQVVFRVMEAEPGAGVSEVLAQVESVALGRDITTLAEEGARKGNFQARWAGLREALGAGRRRTGGFGLAT